MRQTLLHGGAEIVRRRRYILIARPGQSEFHPPARPPQVQAVGLTQAYMRAGDLPQGSAQFLGDFRLAAGALIPRGKRSHNPDPVQVPAPDNRHHIADLAAILIGPQQRLDLG